MIHTVAVLAGEPDYAEAAQQHALRMAQWFQATLRVVTTREPGDVHGATPSERSMETFGEQALVKISKEAENGHVVVKSSVRGEGLLNGLLAEARESDLLVVGLPPETTAGTEPLLQAVRHRELPLLHKAECLVLVVNKPLRPIERILVEYQGGVVGKGALRAAGEVAIRTSSAVTVLCVDGDIGNAGSLASSAEKYLAGFGLPPVATVRRVGRSGLATEIAEVAKSTQADLVVVGGEQHSVLNCMRDRTPDLESVAVFSEAPVWVAR